MGKLIFTTWREATAHRARAQLGLQLGSVILGIEAASLFSPPFQGTHGSCFILLSHQPVIPAPYIFSAHGILHMEPSPSSTIHSDSNSHNCLPSADSYLNSGIRWFVHGWPWDKCPALIQTCVGEKGRQEYMEHGMNLSQQGRFSQRGSGQGQ